MIAWTTFRRMFTGYTVLKTAGLPTRCALTTWFKFASWHVHWPLLCAGPFKQLLDPSQQLNFGVEADDSRRAAYKRTSSSVKAVAERIRADRQAAASLAATGTLGFAGSIGAFSSQGPSLSAKITASQYSLGEHDLSILYHHQHGSIHGILSKCLAWEQKQTGRPCDGSFSCGRQVEKGITCCK